MAASHQLLLEFIDEHRQINQYNLYLIGCMLCLGRTNYFRFNHPEQAMKLKGCTSGETAESVSASDYQHNSRGRGEWKTWVKGAVVTYVYSKGVCSGEYVNIWACRQGCVVGNM